MEKSTANQLPEADSLPDGFVESSAEPTVVSQGQQKQHPQPQPLSFDSDPAPLPLSDRDPDTPLPDSKPRTFPVPLSDKNSFDLSGSPDPIRLDSDSSPSEDPIITPTPQLEPTPDPPTRLEPVHQTCQTLTQSAKQCIELHPGGVKERPASGNTDGPKNKKESSSDVKQKPAKRSLKSEKELLELTLKYQQVVAERDAAISVREKLESLCRELQRQNKLLMDECKRVSAEGQSMRLDLSTKFHDAIKDVSSKLEEQKDECLSQLKENELLRNKLKNLADQYAVAEQQFQQKLKQKSLELQLADLKLQQHQEKSAQEQNQMQMYAEQVSQLLATEKNLRLQLAADGEKFQQFQDALMKTNEVFEAFKSEMEKMAKSIKELKRENIFLKSKCEKSDYTLIELVEERELLKKQLEKARSQKEKLESLCRLLQAERKQNVVSFNSSDPIPTQVSVGLMEE